MDRINRLKRDLQDRKCVKVISGIANFDFDKIRKVVKSATAANATAVDVAAREDIVKETRNLTNLTVFASSINPKELYKAVNNGADVAELGNFDALYEQGIRLSADDVYKLAVETLELIGDNAMICITVPGHLEIKEQITLATNLEELGIDLLQTEGSILSKPQSKGSLGLIEKASITLANTVELSSNVRNIPIITASGIGSVTAPLAIASGASGVGIGKFINSLSMEIEMIAAINSVINSINNFRPVNNFVQV